MVPLPAVSWPWVPAWGSLEPPRRDGENAQKTGIFGEKMGEIRPKKCEGRELTKDQLAGDWRGCAAERRAAADSAWAGDRVRLHYLAQGARNPHPLGLPLSRCWPKLELFAQDGPGPPDRWPHPSDRIVKVFTYLFDCGPDQGATAVVRGSHRIPWGPAGVCESAATSHPLHPW